MKKELDDLIGKLFKEHILSKAEYQIMIEESGKDERELLAKYALQIKKIYYGNKVFTRGLIEFTNLCKNNCYYCGIRAGNKEISRYRLTT